MVEYTSIKFSPRLLSGDELYPSIVRRAREHGFSFSNGDPVAHWEDLKASGYPIPPEDFNCVTSTLLDRYFPARKGHVTFEADIRVSCCFPNGETQIALGLSRDFEALQSRGEQSLTFLAWHAFLEMAKSIAKDLDLEFSKVTDESEVLLSATETAVSLDDPAPIIRLLTNCFEELSPPAPRNHVEWFCSLLCEASEKLLTRRPFQWGFRYGPGIRVSDPIHLITSDYGAIQPLGMEMTEVESFLRANDPPAVVASFVVGDDSPDVSDFLDLHFVSCGGRAFLLSDSTLREIREELERPDISLRFLSLLD